MNGVRKLMANKEMYKLLGQSYVRLKLIEDSLDKTKLGFENFNDFMGSEKDYVKDNFNLVNKQLIDSTKDLFQNIIDLQSIVTLINTEYKMIIDSEFSEIEEESNSEKEDEERINL